MAVNEPVVFVYDGSFPGLLCCIHESLQGNVIPEDVCPVDSSRLYLYPSQHIPTDEKKSRELQKWLRRICGDEVLRFSREAFLTCLPGREMHLLRFVHLARSKGPGVLKMLNHDQVIPLQKAVLHLRRESHLLKGFVRFSLRQGVLSATIGPKNIVLPLLAEHFSTRFAGERFMIYDSTNHMVLLHDPPRLELISVTGIDPGCDDPGEKEIADMWRLFYETIAVPDRENPRLRMSLMPKRYWKYMTEFL
mgnify:CR=1 FL=1